MVVSGRIAGAEVRMICGVVGRIVVCPIRGVPGCTIRICVCPILPVDITVWPIGRIWA